jgi:hypothetical protein
VADVGSLQTRLMEQSGNVALWCPILKGQIFIKIYFLCELNSAHGCEDLCCAHLFYNTYSLARRYKHFGKSYCLYLQANVNQNFGDYLQEHTLSSFTRNNKKLAKCLSCSFHVIKIIKLYRTCKIRT